MLDLDKLIAEALAEDIGHGDLTVRAVVPPQVSCTSRLMAKEAGVLSGIEVFRRVFEKVGAGTVSWSMASDGARFEAGDCLAEGRGPAALILQGERVALNFVQRLSGVATMT